MLEGIEEEEREEESPSSWHKMTPKLESSMISDSGYKSRHSQPECGYALESSQWTEYSIHTMDPDNLELTFEFFEVQKSLVLFNRKILSTNALQSILMEFLKSIYIHFAWILLVTYEFYVTSLLFRRTWVRPWFRVMSTQVTWALHTSCRPFLWRVEKIRVWPPYPSWAGIPDRPLEKLEV